mmetsp:Transcript_18473/g.40489  ORF Transcript_18473/g.40489 Transcript_18473/m.40489 type:complete len:215 (-) Transcript_18473:32-676(-)
MSGGVIHRLLSRSFPLLSAMQTSSRPIGEWVEALGAKAPTPGGGAAAAVTAAIGVASGAMAAIYTTGKKYEASGVAEEARVLAARLQDAAKRCVAAADEDAAAYGALQATWKAQEPPLSDEEKKRIEAEALDVPVRLLRLCHGEAKAVAEFLPRCNPNITSDAKVALHLLAGAGRAAYQTVLVNSPPEELVTQLQELLSDLACFEAAAMTKASV